MHITHSRVDTRDTRASSCSVARLSCTVSLLLRSLGSAGRRRARERRERCQESLSSFARSCARRRMHSLPRRRSSCCCKRRSRSGIQRRPGLCAGPVRWRYRTAVVFAHLRLCFGHHLAQLHPVWPRPSISELRESLEHVAGNAHFPVNQTSHPLASQHARSGLVRHGCARSLGHDVC